MKQTLAEVIEEAIGKPPDGWITREAPETERSGSA